MLYTKPPKDKSQPEPIEWSCDPYGELGVGETNRHCDRVASNGFGGCIGMIVQDAESNKAYGFHFFRGVVTEGQARMLRKIAKSGKPHNACFITGDEAFSPYESMNYCTGSLDETRPLVDILEDKVPNLIWQPTIELPVRGWGFDYDAKARSLTIKHEGQVHRQVDNPLGLEPMKWVERSVMGPGESMARTK